MKKLIFISKLAAVMLLLSVLLLTACGALKLDSITVDRSTVKTAYYLGEEIDFSGIKVTVRYNDKSLDCELTYDDITIEYPSDITDTVGTKTVTVRYDDPHLETVIETTVQISVTEDPNAVKHQSYAIDSADVKSAYIVGESLDFSGIKISEIMTDGSTVPMTDLSAVEYVYDDGITASVGTKSVTVKYNGESAGAIQITVRNPSVTAAEIDTSDVSLLYNKGDAVTLSGLKVNLTYENGLTRTVTTFSFVTDLATVSASTGEKNIDFTYTEPISGATRTGKLTVRIDGVLRYIVDTSAVKREYFEKETVSFEGIVVTAKYAYSPDRVLDFSELTFDYPSDVTETPGSKLITLKVGGENVVQFSISVGDITGIATVNTDGVKCSYRVGDTVTADSFAGLTLLITYNNGAPATSVTDLSDITFVTDLAALTETAGYKQIFVKYADSVTGGDIYNSFAVTVYGIESYRIDDSGMKTSYIVGDTLTTAGVKVYAVYGDDGPEVEVPLSELTFGSVDNTTEGGKLVTVQRGTESVGTISVNFEKNAITKLEVGGSYDAIYDVGADTDFTGLYITVTYKNGQTKKINLSEITLVGANTSAAGTVTVTANFTDPVNNEPASTTFNITVVVRNTIRTFEKPAALTEFNADKASAGTLTYNKNDAAGFSGQFANGNITYSIGSANPFKLTPVFEVMENGTPTLKTNFYTTVEIYLHDGTNYNKLTKSVSGTAATYKNGTTVIATVDTYKGSYQFTSAAVGKKVKLEVLPSSDYYVVDSSTTALTLEAKIIDAYNLYEAYELSLIDNYNSAWNDFRAEKGLSGVGEIKGIVFHNNISITSADVPASFFHVFNNPTVYPNGYPYHNGNDKSEPPVYSYSPNGTKYLVDGTNVYQRLSADDFVIEGNFFTLSVKDFPVVASPSVFGTDSNKDYGSDFSNASLFWFGTNDLSNVWGDAPADKANNSISNLALIGNAQRNSIVDENGNLKSAGGLIFFKSSTYATASFDNVIGNSFFITYFAEYGATINATDVKCFDSFQNGLMAWGNSVINLTDCYFNGTGGPVIINQSVEEGDVWYNPILNADNTVMDTSLTGQEIWFTSVNANATVGLLKALSSGLQQAELGSFVSSEDKMNIMGLLMLSGTDAEVISTGLDAQGALSFTSDTTTYYGIERWKDSAYWASIYNHPAFSQGAAFLTVYDASGNAYTVYTDTTNLYDVNGNQFGTLAEHAAIADAFRNADYITVSQGGMSILFEFYH